jgi:hypothetical protein
MAYAPTRRPGVVTFVGVILIVQGFLALIEGIVLLSFRDDVQDFLADYGETISDTTTTGFAIGSLIAGALLILAGSGILSGSRAWRNIVTVIVTLRMGFALFAMIAHPHGAYFTSGLVTLLVGTFVIWALYGHKESDDFYASTS